MYGLLLIGLLLLLPILALSPTSTAQHDETVQARKSETAQAPAHTFKQSKPQGRAREDSPGLLERLVDLDAPLTFASLHNASSTSRLKRAAAEKEQADKEVPTAARLTTPSGARR